MDETVVIWNPSAGSVALAEELKAALCRRPGIELLEPQSREATLAAAAEAARRHAKCVVAAGGDGTINAVVNGLMHEPGQTRLAVLPLGTANDFSFTLGMPDDPLEALSVIEQPQVETMDVVRVETAEQSTHFINVATGGNSDQVTANLTPEMKQRWGALCYLRGAIEVIADLTSFSTKLRFDDGPPETYSAWNLILANGRTAAGRIGIAPRANPQDGLMEVIVIEEGTMVDLASLATDFVFSDYLESERIIYRRVGKVTIESDPPLRYAADGEIITGHPATFQLLPQALDVVVGPQYVAEIQQQEVPSPPLF